MMAIWMLLSLKLNGKTGTALWCLINDGTGYLNKRKCGGIFSFALELADMDGDGYLDVLLGAHEYEQSIDFTGIVWNDGRVILINIIIPAYLNIKRNGGQCLKFQQPI